MNKNMIAKLVVKGVLGLAVSSAIGYAIKGQRILDARIDEYFATAVNTVMKTP